MVVIRVIAVPGHAIAKLQAMIAKISRQNSLAERRAGMLTQAVSEGQ
jgi:hypothetical protein